ncbi:hypothetical protein EDD85DRAFT_1025618 [Armillaria nabsnona]|nr:hypothetical protein EDD85DRAFT_1025618 [Armillaria nabsnona]
MFEEGLKQSGWSNGPATVNHKVKETSPERAETVQLSGTTIIIPGYIDNYEAFKSKGVTGIYVVAVNVQFVMKEIGTPIHFLADDQGEFAGATGLIFNATPLLGGPRSKRYVMIVKNHEVAVK